MTRDPSFEVVTPDGEPDETLIVGIADAGVAGLTAVDYLTTHAETEGIGHVRARNLPDITPFSEGVPRHPIRLYRLTEPGVTVCLSELFLPVWVADVLSDALFEWLSGTGVREVVVPYGAPYPHAEAEHVVSYVGTDGFREAHFPDDETGIEPLAGGFFDGVVGELMSRGLDDSAPSVGALVTPAHLPGPDLDGAVRLIDGLNAVYDIGIDESELRDRSEEMKRYYEGLAQRMETLREGDASLRNRDFPEDRMYM